MPGTCSLSVNIIGGTYREVCFEPQWNRVYGSGFRAVSFFRAMNDGINIAFHSSAGANEHVVLTSKLRKATNLTLNLHKTHETTGFYYENPFRVSSIHPRPDALYAHKPYIEAKGENVLVFGMIDCDFRVEGENVVYDPQSSVMQTRFSQTGSQSKRLVLIMNYTEAKEMSGKDGLMEIRDQLFMQEGCFALIIKMGAKGAILFRDVIDEGYYIPVYLTEHFFLIGSGDIFTACFAYHWFTGLSLEDSAELASKAVACYSETRDISKIKEMLPEVQFPRSEKKTLSKSRRVYLAGPFFTYAQRWLINELYRCLKDCGVEVFSPYHDVGIGSATEVTDLDIEGLEGADIVMAVVDGLDSGTLFEVGYAKSKAKTVIVYSEKESEKALQMMEGTHCIMIRDFTEAIYKTCWHAFQ